MKLPLKRSCLTYKLFCSLTRYCNRAQNRLELRDTKAEPDLSGLPIIKSADLICHLWQQYINIALLPLASTSVTLRREMSIFSSQTINRVEGAANTLMQKIIDGMYGTDPPTYAILTPHFQLSCRTLRFNLTSRRRTISSLAMTISRLHA